MVVLTQRETMTQEGKFLGIFSGVMMVILGFVWSDFMAQRSKSLAVFYLTIKYNFVGKMVYFVSKRFILI